jgi:hypothetical protein
VLAVENRQIAPLPVSGNQNQPSTAPTLTRPDSFHFPARFGSKTWSRTSAAYRSLVERRAVSVIR